MPSRPRVLIAGTEIAIATCERLIGEAADVVAARSLAEALERIEPTVALIISSVRFDESRMFDFLTGLEARRDRCRAAVICCRIVRTPRSAALYGAQARRADLRAPRRAGARARLGAGSRSLVLGPRRRRRAGLP